MDVGTVMSDHPMMKCGCAAQGTCSHDGNKSYDPPVPACVIHDCLELAEPEDLTGRLARCAYYGKRPYKNESNFGCQGQYVCLCEEASSEFERLPFFERKRERDFDSFYCGCHSWD